MLEVYLLLQCNVVNLRVLANCCVWNYTPVEKHDEQVTLAEEFSDLRMLALFLFMRSIPPTWRLVMIMTSMTSLHLMHTASPCRLENVDPSILKTTTIAVPAPTLGDSPGREYIAEDDFKKFSGGTAGRVKSGQPAMQSSTCLCLRRRLYKDEQRRRAEVFFYTNVHQSLPSAVRFPGARPVAECSPRPTWRETAGRKYILQSVRRRGPNAQINQDLTTYPAVRAALSHSPLDQSLRGPCLGRSHSCRSCGIVFYRPTPYR